MPGRPVLPCLGSDRRPRCLSAGTPAPRARSTACPAWAAGCAARPERRSWSGSGPAQCACETRGCSVEGGAGSGPAAQQHSHVQTKLRAHHVQARQAVANDRLLGGAVGWRARRVPRRRHARVQHLQAGSGWRKKKLVSNGGGVPAECVLPAAAVGSSGLKGRASHSRRKYNECSPPAGAVCPACRRGRKRERGLQGKKERGREEAVEGRGWDAARRRLMPLCLSPQQPITTLPRRRPCQSGAPPLPP